MSKQTITDKANVIRRETQQFGNTRGRVADVIDDINETKADKVDLDAAVNESLEPLKQRVSVVETSNSNHINDKNNPHQVNKSQVGLGNVDNTSDANKPISNAQQTEFNKKVDKPTSDGSWVLSKLGNIFTWLNANEFGKNIANSFLTSVANAGINLGAIWKIVTNGFPFYITGLPEKSNDATFNKLLVQDGNGVVSTSNGKQIIVGMPTLLSDAEKAAWKTEMNGGWTTGSMSVFLINPVVINNNNNNQYVTILGANLNFNPANFTVEIVTGTSTATSYTVVATIPNAQVQMQSNGLSLVFYYNFSDLPIGSYKVRLWNGVASYVTSVDFGLVNSVNNYDLSGLKWDVKTINDQPLSTSIVGTTSVSFKGYVNGADPTALPDGTPYISATSSQLGGNATMMDDFVIEFALFWEFPTFQPIYGGVVDDISFNLNNTISYGASATTSLTNLINGYAVNGVNSANNRVIVYKKGNSMTVIVSNSNGAAVGQASVNLDTKPIKLKIYRASDTVPERNNMLSSLQLISAYKTN